MELLPEVRAEQLGVKVKDDFLARRLKVIQQTSSSQIEPFERCHRRWFFNYIEVGRQEPTPAQLRGTDIDDNYVQPYLLDGTIRAGEHTELLKVTIPYLPKPGPNLSIQFKVELPTYKGGPVVIGYGDFSELFPDTRHLAIGDLKSTSDFKYCKTEEQLANNTQLLTYARYGYEVFGAKSVSVAHIYARTKGAKKACKVGPVPVSRAHVAAKWAERMESVKLMAVAAKTTVLGTDLEPNAEACGDYGGCPFRSKCGFLTFGRNKQIKPKEKVKMEGESLAARLKRSKMANGHAVAPATEPKPTAAAPVAAPAADDVVPPGMMKCPDCRRGWMKSMEVGAPPGAFVQCTTCNKTGFITAPVNEGAGDSIIPPDAPTRRSTPEEIETVANAPKKRGRPPKKPQPLKMRLEGILYEIEVDDDGNELSRVQVDPPLAAAPAVAAPAPVAPPVVAPPAAPPAAPTETHPASWLSSQKELREALASKRTEARKKPATAPILYIDCLPVKSKGEAAMTLEEWLDPIAELAALTNEVSDVRLISYTSKGVLATAVRECLDTCPPALLIDSRQFGADVVLECLTPYAALIIRGIR